MDDFPFPIPEGLNIAFNVADLDFELTNPNAIVEWIKSVIELEAGNVASLCYIFCSDAYLHKLNVEYLDHDTLTDIITFPISEDPIQSDLYISIERVKENALERNVPFDKELHRVMVHGLLHLLGYGDKTSSDKVTMRAKENDYLNHFFQQ